VSVKDRADCPPFDAEPFAQLVHRRSVLVAGDEFMDLVGAELLCPSGFGLTGGGAGVVGSGSFRSRVSRASTWGFVL
jgi:hypothetical protein